jgi:uncharacterized protein (DUF1684 family)
MKISLLCLIIGWAILVIPGCQSRLSNEEKQIVAEIRQERAEKDSIFGEADWSPIPENERGDFAGLNYYPIDFKWRFQGPIMQYDTIIRDTIVGTKGDLRPAQRYGYFEFEIDNKKHRLEIYTIIRPDTAYQDYLFLGFTDETTGKSTYGTGRYIDLTIRMDNYYLIDFNKAYNPYCAYNPKYTCAIPPDENALPFAVKAGEKIYKQH